MCMAHASTPRRITANSSNQDKCLLYKTLSFRFNTLISQVPLTRNYVFFFFIANSIGYTSMLGQRKRTQWCT